MFLETDGGMTPKPTNGFSQNWYKIAAQITTRYNRHADVFMAAIIIATIVTWWISCVLSLVLFQPCLQHLQFLTDPFQFIFFHTALTVKCL